MSTIKFSIGTCTIAFIIVYLSIFFSHMQIFRSKNVFSFHQFLTDFSNHTIFFSAIEKRSIKWTDVIYIFALLTFLSPNSLFGQTLLCALSFVKRKEQLAKRTCIWWMNYSWLGLCSLLYHLYYYFTLKVYANANNLNGIDAHICAAVFAEFWS